MWAPLLWRCNEAVDDQLPLGDLDKTAAQLEAAGIGVRIAPRTYPSGRIGRWQEPEGNPIELCQPKVADTKGQVAKQCSTVSEYFLSNRHS
jgi:hypothetical protein